MLQKIFQMAITFALIKERKNPPDRRVVFSPEMCQEVIKHYPDARIIAETSDIRIFKDEAYRKAGVEICEDISKADVMLGVKEVPVEALIPHKKYFFFSHTIKKQPYNRALLQAILQKKIELYDHETITKENGSRLIGFGRYAGLVGAYNGFRALGLRDKLYTLEKVDVLPDLDAVKEELDKIEIPTIKIVTRKEFIKNKKASLDIEDKNVIRIECENVIHNIMQPYQKKSMGNSYGSGFFISDKHVLTNHHVIEHAAKIFINIPKAKRRESFNNDFRKIMHQIRVFFKEKFILIIKKINIIKKIFF